MSSPDDTDKRDTHKEDHLGHRRRLRERFVKTGGEGLADYEIIELLLTFAIPRRDTKPIAKELLRRFNNIQGVLEAPREELLSIPGVGENAAFLIKFFLAAPALYLRERIRKREYLRSAGDVLKYLKVSMMSLKHEVFKAFYLNAQNEILDSEDLFEGTVDSSVVWVRDVVAKAIKAGATGLIFVHNHPSGNPEPSDSDKEVTRDLVYAGKIMQIKVLDHIIIGDNRYFSFAAAGLIERYEMDFLTLKMKGSGVVGREVGEDKQRDLPWRRDA